ncbi:MAG: PKD domain-containing protein, partial [Phycisphaeraceae bacterium JB051]
MSVAGDVNGDGYDDLLIGAHKHDPDENTDAGAVYLVYGHATQLTGIVELSDIASGSVLGAVFNGVAEGDKTGESVSAAGDVNGDGYDDILIGASRADVDGDIDAGKTYLVYGQSSGLTGAIDLSAIASGGVAGAVFTGIKADDRSGVSVAHAGDVNGDGCADFLIGAHGADPNSQMTAGQTYLIYGHASRLSGEIELADVVSGLYSGAVFNGIDQDDSAGFSTSTAGDVNGDGYDDLLIGAYRVASGVNFSVGQAYLVYGAENVVDPVELSGLIELSGIGTGDLAGFVLNGEAYSDKSGYSISDAGDVNGDGYADLLISASWADPYDKNNAGKTYLIYGDSSGFAQQVDLSDILAGRLAGAVFVGHDSGDNIGLSVSGAGDVNGDGYDDILIGAKHAEADYPQYVFDAGQTYLIYGQPTGLTGEIHLSEIESGQLAGAIFNGIDMNDNSGQSVSTAGDVNGDGCDDLLIIAAPRETGEDVTEGEVYLVYGQTTGLTGAFYLSAIESGNLDGAVFYGLTGFDGYPFSVSNAGDVNADGYDDMLVGTQSGDPVNRSNAGQTYLIYGDASEFSGVYDLSQIASGSLHGVLFNGIASGDRSGSSVSGAGDVNGDGFDDLIIGAYAANGGGDSYDGETYLVYGHASALSGEIELVDIETGDLAGVLFNGIDQGDSSGACVSGAGDVNGDGYDDILIATRFAGPSGRTSAGGTYLVYGLPMGLSGVMELSDLVSGSLAGAVFFGIDSFDHSGYSVSDAGDVNADGFADLLIGAYGADPLGHSGAGETYLIYGASTTQYNITGKAWVDSNYDDMQSEIEVGRGGMTVNLYTEQGHLRASTTTDVNGQYTFANLFPGRYTIEFVTSDDDILVLQNQGDDAIDSDVDSSTGQYAFELQLADIQIDAGVYDTTPQVVLDPIARTAAGQTVTVNAQFTDVDSLGPFTAVVDWGDGTIQTLDASNSGLTDPLYDGDGSLSIVFDYSYDSEGFFDDPVRRELLQRAGEIVSARITDELEAIIPTGSNTWAIRFYDPATGNLVVIDDVQIQENEILVFAGGRDLDGPLGRGGYGGWSGSGTSAWFDNIRTRGQDGANDTPATDVSVWGGSIAFDTAILGGDTYSWYFGTDPTQIASNEFDFFSVAAHELMHVLGFGTAASWDALIDMGTAAAGDETFIGQASMAAYDTSPGSPLPLDSGLGHWLDGTIDSDLEAAMDPSISNGTRKLITPLDFAGLDDIGWEFQASTGVGSLQLNHVYDTEGQYNVTVTITDTSGLDGTVFQTVNIQDNHAPQVTVGDNQAVDEGDTVNFNGSFTDEDVTDTHTYLWDFGDGSTTTGT